MTFVPVEFPDEGWLVSFRHLNWHEYRSPPVNRPVNCATCCTVGNAYCVPVPLQLMWKRPDVARIVKVQIIKKDWEKRSKLTTPTTTWLTYSFLFTISGSERHTRLFGETSLTKFIFIYLCIFLKQ